VRGSIANKGEAEAPHIDGENPDAVQIDQVGMKSSLNCELGRLNKQSLVASGIPSFLTPRNQLLDNHSLDGSTRRSTLHAQLEKVLCVYYLWT